MAIVYPTTADFDDLTKDGFWIADFYTSMCGPCKLLDVIINDIVTENPDINWAKCNLENDWGFQDKFDVQGTPTLIYFMGGEIKGRHVGGFCTREEIEEEISKCMYGD